MAWSVGRLVGRSVVLEDLGKELRVEPRLEAMAMKAHAKWVRPSRPVPEIWVHGTTEGPATVEEVSSEDELEDITPVMEEVWTPRTMLRSQRGRFQVRWTTPRRLASPSACSARSGVQRDT